MCLVFEIANLMVLFSSCTTYFSNNALIIALSVRARLADVKKLSVVTFLPLFKYGDMSRITMLSGSDSLAERS